MQNRWELIEATLLGPIRSPVELQVSKAKSAYGLISSLTVTLNYLGLVFQSWIKITQGSRKIWIQI